MLADFEIIKAIQDDWIGVEPFDVTRVQPVSLDLTLAEDIRVAMEDHRAPTLIDPKGIAARGLQPGGGQDYMRPVSIKPAGYELRRREFLLACTQETIALSPSIAARVEGKSSLGRLGLQVHITAGFIDPGFEGQITLEIYNVAPWDVQLYAGMPIAQIVFSPVSTPERDYSKTGHYQNQQGPTESVYRLR